MLGLAVLLSTWIFASLRLSVFAFPLLPQTMKHTTKHLCALAIACCLAARATCAQAQADAGQEQTVAFMRITDQDAAASRLLGQGHDARAYLAFRKSEQLCVAFLKRYPKGEYAVDAILRFSQEELAIWKTAPANRAPRPRRARPGVRP